MRIIEIGSVRLYIEPELILPKVIADFYSGNESVTRS
jgi:hypothetical protein